MSDTMTVKNCLLCQHCHYDSLSPGYSELTPGSDASLRCDKSAMKHANGRNLFEEAFSRQQLREALATAETCDYYEPDPT